MSKQHESEEQLLQRARDALSNCNWEIGECAAQWTERYARGRTDADFGGLVGLSGDQVYQRRRVWETFSDVQGSYDRLKWSHFYAALNWDDAADCLQWADDMQATVAEMKAWRRAQHGEDLTAPAAEENAALAAVELLPMETSAVREVELSEATGESERRRSDGSGSETATVVGAPREAGAPDDYAPFGNKARGSASAGTAVADRPQPSPEAILKRVAAALEKCDASLTPDVLDAFPDVPVKLRKRLLMSLQNLARKTEGLKVH